MSISILARFICFFYIFQGELPITHHEKTKVVNLKGLYGEVLNQIRPEHIYYSMKLVTYCYIWLYVSCCVIFLFTVLWRNIPSWVFGICLNRSDGYEPSGH